MKSISKIKKTFAMSLLLSGALLVLFWCKDVDLSSTMMRTVKLNVKNKLCFVNVIDGRMYISNETDLKMIYYVTPTYPRAEQIPELTRLSHTLMHVPRLHWIVADDQPDCSNRVLSVLRKTGLPFTYISSPKPYLYTATAGSGRFPRGVANRLAALAWLHENVSQGVLYFGDDDNTVDLELFDEIRQTKKVSMFPVGLIGKYGVSSPVVNNGKVVAFFEPWSGRRTYPVDMAGFAVNIEFLKPSATMPYEEGYEEDKFLQSLGLNIDDIEPLAANCSKVLVWHTKTVKNKIPSLKVDLRKLHSRSKYKYFAGLLEEVSSMNMAHLNPNTGNRAYLLRDRKQIGSLSDLK